MAAFSKPRRFLRLVWIAPKFEKCSMEAELSAGADFGHHLLCARSRSILLLTLSAQSMHFDLLPSSRLKELPDMIARSATFDSSHDSNLRYCICNTAD